MLVSRGDAPRVARRLPLAIILRAFGAETPDLDTVSITYGTSIRSTLLGVPDEEGCDVRSNALDTIHRSRIKTSFGLDSFL